MNISSIWLFPYLHEETLPNTGQKTKQLFKRKYHLTSQVPRIWNGWGKTTQFVRWKFQSLSLILKWPWYFRWCHVNISVKHPVVGGPCIIWFRLVKIEGIAFFFFTFLWQELLLLRIYLNNHYFCRYFSFFLFSIFFSFPMVNVTLWVCIIFRCISL